MNFYVDTHNCPFTFFVTLTDLLFLLYKTFFCICYVFLSFFHHFTIFFVFPIFVTRCHCLSNFSFFKKIFFYFFPKRTKKRKKKSLYVIGVTIFGGVRSFLNGHRHRRQYRDRLTIFFFAFFQIFIFMVPIVLGQGHLSESHSFKVMVWLSDFVCPVK